MKRSPGPQKRQLETGTQLITFSPSLVAVGGVGRWPPEVLAEATVPNPHAPSP